MTILDAILPSPAEWSAIRLSVLVATGAVVGSLPFGVAIGWWLARGASRARVLVEVLVNLPLVMPPVVTGWLLLITFGTRGWIGRHLDEWFGIRLVFDWKGAALAAAIVSLPLMVRSIRIAFASVDHRVEDAARTLGAGPFDVFRNVTLPLAWHGVLAGSVLAFARALGEFGATIMVAGSIAGETRTIPLFVYDMLQSPEGIEAAWRIVVISILIAAAALVASEWLERRARRHLDRAPARRPASRGTTPSREPGVRLRDDRGEGGVP